MTAEAVTPSPFEPVILEDDPAFDVQKEYREELDYYYETHPNDKGYVPPKSLKESAVGMMNGLRNGLVKVVEIRDELYGYNDQTKGPRIHLKPEAEMQFLPDGMNYTGAGQDRSPFDIGLSMPNIDFGLHPVSQPKEKKHSCVKKAKKHNCCSCKDTGCLDNPRHCSREKKHPRDTSSPKIDILSADPFGITKKKG
jgi:hypothetical protein